jgi:predicted lipoprotein
MSPGVRLRLTAALMLAVYACGGGGTPAPQAGPRRIMLQDVGQLVILPTYDSLVAEASGLASAAATLELTPDASTLAGAQDAWRRARAVWKQSEAFAIGPAETLRTANRIDWSPVRTDRIEAELASDDAITAAWVEDLGTNLKGFLAIEYLLFDPVGGDSAVLQAVTGEDGPRRRAFIRAASENLRDQTILLRDAWAPTGGDFVGTLAAAGPGNATFPTVKSAVDKLVNQLIFLAEDVADHQLLVPLGVRNGGVPRPDLIDANRSGNGMSDLLDNLTGLQNVYFAVYGDRRGQGFSAIVSELNPQTDNVLGLAIRRSFETATRISVPLEEAVSDEPELVSRAQVRSKELMQRLEVDLVSVLGSTLRFNPSDGD